MTPTWKYNFYFEFICKFNIHIIKIQYHELFKWSFHNWWICFWYRKFIKIQYSTASVWSSPTIMEIVKNLKIKIMQGMQIEITFMNRNRKLWNYCYQKVNKNINNFEMKNWISNQNNDEFVNDMVNFWT